MITTDYTVKNTLRGAPFGRYRFSGWLSDIIRNFVADPVNLRDERLALLMAHALKADPDAEIVRVDVPYSKDSRKACATPAILVGTGNTDYPVQHINLLQCATDPVSGAKRAWGNDVLRRIGATVAVLTESCAGTELLAGVLEDFLLTNAQQFTHDGFVRELRVTGSSAPQRIGAGEGGNAKDLYQVVISLQASGNVRWETDTQGPVFRGITTNVTVN